MSPIAAEPAVRRLYRVINDFPERNIVMLHHRIVELLLFTIKGVRI